MTRVWMATTSKRQADQGRGFWSVEAPSKRAAKAAALEIARAVAKRNGIDPATIRRVYVWEAK